MSGTVPGEVLRQKKKKSILNEVYILVGGDNKGVDKYINKDNFTC